jgi:hypothetical protein
MFNNAMGVRYFVSLMNETYNGDSSGLDYGIPSVAWVTNIS